MLKVIIVLAIIIGLGGHFVPIKTYSSDQYPGSLLPVKVVNKEYRSITGGYSDFKKNTESINCDKIGCDVIIQKLYLW